MRFDIFKQGFALTLFWLVSVMALFVYRDINAPVTLLADFENLSPLYTLIAGLENMLPDIAVYLFIVLIMLWNGLIITRILIRNMMVQERTYMPIILYVLLSCGSYFGQLTFIALIISSLVLYSCYLMIRSFSRDVSYGVIFNSSFIAGVAVLIYVRMLLLLLIIAVALILFKKNGRAVIVSLTGFVLPFAILSYIYWGIGYPMCYVAEQMNSQICNIINNSSSFIANLRDPILLLQWVTVAVGMILAVITFLRQSSYIRTRPYKLFVYFIWLMIVLLPMFILVGRSVIDIYIMAIPLTVLLSVYFAKARGIVPKVVYLLLLIAVILYNLLPVIFS